MGGWVRVGGLGAWLVGWLIGRTLAQPGAHERAACKSRVDN